MVDVAVDIGNTRVKWGRFAADCVEFVESLADTETAWNAAATTHFGKAPIRWAVASVHPQRRDRFAAWVQSRGEECRIISSAEQIPIQVDVDFPNQVGIDRLLNAGAANQFREPSRPAVVIDAGTAITVDLVDANGVFRGGCILPGLRLMSQSLHEQTAKLPQIESFAETAPLPPRNTEAAIRVGIMEMLLGGLERIAQVLLGTVNCRVEEGEFLFAGGNGKLLCERMLFPRRRWLPTLTLEGIRLAVAHRP